MRGIVVRKIMQAFLALSIVVLPAAALPFSEVEKRFVQAHPTVRVGLIPGFAPYMFVGKDGSFQGIIPDYLRLIEARAGISFRHAPLDLAELDAAMGAGIDLFPGVESPERRRRMGFTETFMSDPWVLVNRRDAPLVTGVRDLNDRTISLVDNIYIQGRLEADYPDIRIRPADDHPQALEAVSTGRADAYIGPLSVAGYLMLHNRLTHLKIAAPSGYPPAEVKFGVRKDWPELVEILDNAISTVARQEVDAIFRKWVPVRYERDADWTWVWRWIAGIVIVFGILLGVSLSWNRKLTAEIHERKRTEEALKKSQTLLKKAEDLSDIGGYEYDIPSGRLVFSDGWMRIHGCEKRTMAVEELLPIAFPEDVPKIEKAFNDALKNIRPYHLEHRIVRQNDGAVRVIQSSAKVIFDDAGRPVKMYGSVQDVTDRKTAEALLEKERRKLFFVLDSLPAFVYLQASDYSIAFSNKRFRDMFGEPDGRSCYKLVQDRETPCPRCPTFEVFDTRRPINWEWESEDGRAYMVYDSLFPDEYYGEEMVLEVGLDITDRKKAEARLKEYSERLEEMVKDRTRELEQAQEELLVRERLAVLGHFAGSVSHELRNPLGAIDASIYYLQMKLGTGDGKIADHLARARANIARSTAIIESLLNLSRMEKPRTRPHAVDQLMSDILGSAKIPETVQTDTIFPENEAAVEVDPDQIRMALKNILHNAVQAMEGSGTLTIAVQPSDENQVEIRISDTGPGIAPENLEKIFQPLFSTKTHGIGFGLSIAKMIVEKHGGSIRAESAPGKGATFTITFPMAAKPGRTS